MENIPERNMHCIEMWKRTWIEKKQEEKSVSISLRKGGGNLKLIIMQNQAGKQRKFRHRDPQY